MIGARGPLTLRRIVGGAFGIVLSRPAPLAVWALIYSVAMAAFTFATRLGLPLQPEIQAGGNPAAFASLGSSLLVDLLFLVVFMTLLAAAMRSVLEPARSGFAFLGLGTDELRQIGLAMLFLILFYVGLIPVGIVLGLVAALAIAVAGAGTTMFAVLGVGAAVSGIFICWLAVRLSLSFPLTLLRGAITISESWRLTRGRFWALFGGYFLIFLVIALLTLGIASVTLADYWRGLARGGFTIESLQAAARGQVARQLGPIDGMMLLGWVLGGTGGALGVALQGGALAAAARDLADVRDEMAETFG